jgi:hypothetical protein
VFVVLICSYYYRRFSVTEANRFAEYFVGICGPPVHHADNLLRRALDLHFKSKKWHFFTNAFKLWNSNPQESKTIKTLKNVKPVFSFAVQVIFVNIVKFIGLPPSRGLYAGNLYLYFMILFMKLKTFIRSILLNHNFTSLPKKSIFSLFFTFLGGSGS